MEEVLHGCLPAVLVHILPVFAASKMHRSEANVSVTQHDLANATSCYDSLVKILGKEVCRHCGGGLEFFLLLGGRREVKLSCAEVLCDSPATAAMFVIVLMAAQWSGSD